jgi:hypothetical protein
MDRLNILHMKLNKLKQIIKEEILKEIKIEKPSNARLIFIPIPVAGSNIDPTTGEKGEPKLVLGNEYMIARNDIKIPKEYIRVNPGLADFNNNLWGGKYLIAVDENGDLQEIKDLLDKYEIKYTTSYGEASKITTIFINFDQISNTEGWES